MTPTRLGDHAKFIRGVTFKPAQTCNPRAKGALACMRTKNVQTALDESDLIGVPRDVVKNEEKILKPGDILVSSANSWNLVGKCCYVPQLDYPATAGGFISILRPTNGDLDHRYLFRWFSSDSIQNIVRSLGNQTTNISNLNHKRALNLTIPLPPLAEQKRIAAILDAADALRAKRREALAQLDTLLQSTFLDMFGDPVTNPKGWDRTELGSLIEAGDKINYGVVQPGDDWPNGKPLIRVGDFVGGELDTTCVKLIDPKIEKKYERSRLNGRELLVSCVGSIGTVCKVPNHAKDFNIARAVARVPLKERISRDFMIQCLRSEAVQRYFLKETRTVSQPTLNISLIKNAPVIQPPEDLQHHFASVVGVIEEQKTDQRAHRTELDALFASLQSRAFRGDLDAW